MKVVRHYLSDIERLKISMGLQRIKQAFHLILRSTHLGSPMTAHDYPKPNRMSDVSLH
jgi:hypothetical protein